MNLIIEIPEDKLQTAIMISSATDPDVIEQKDAIKTHETVTVCPDELAALMGKKEFSDNLILSSAIVAVRKIVNSLKYQDNEKDRQDPDQQP